MGRQRWDRPEVALEGGPHGLAEASSRSGSGKGGSIRRVMELTFPCP